ncbi:RNA-dependent RNA polymerase [Sclerotinia sclerotiorum mitovirus 4]|uniref:RNA-dependent RNA polymerase n=1 Tax=Sclerotinia sclerotiorum mitovirus 4 TaxID=1279100 RepID=A0ABM5NE54_9VIRU|nr:RNA-dependent RNA polymerase [Sclerotinia sclerotiorum mitovirus 4]AGC24233.1 RNA-dependent RNA polymerase [Sclerotinia sclerotiorum mitovirus 4]
MNNKIRNIIIIRLLRLCFNFNNNTWEITRFLETFDEMRQKSGLKYTIKYYKAVKLHITRYICGQPLLSNKEGVALDHSGWPKKFLYLKKFIKTNKELRILLTLLSFTRTIVPNKKEELKIKPDYSTIDAPYKGKVYTIPAWFIKNWISKHNLKADLPTYDVKDHYVSMKSSPNGPATHSSLWSILSLSYPQLQNISTMLGTYRDEFFKFYSTAWNNDFNKSGDIINPKWTNYTGKLSIVKDPELKRRVIAMVDYHSQFTLKPIHEMLLNKLSTLKCDRTFTQDPKHSWYQNHHKFYSLDLSAATDRFPLQLQKKLLSYIYENKQFCDAWADLLTSRPYIDSDGNQHFYNVGQPMGAYSSWAAFTISHHLVVAWAAHLCGEYNFSQYIILGDDIVIKNDKVANKYITIMTRLGVDISINKTHVSKDTYEFAKRWIKGGIEVSGIPLKGILNQWKNPGVVYTTLCSYFDKNPIQPIPLINLMCELYNKLPFGKRRNSFNQMHKMLYDFHHAMRYSLDKLTYDELRAYLCNKAREDSFMVPGNNIILHFMKLLLSGGMVSEAEKVSRQILSEYTRIENKFKTSYDDLNVLSGYPLLNGYYNHLSSMKDKIIKWENDPNTTLIDSALSLRVEKFDKIANLHRNKTESISTLSKLWKLSMKGLWRERIEDDFEYMTFISRINQDTTDSLLPVYTWESVLDNNIQFTLNQLKPLISGNIVKVEKNSWENLDWGDFKV